MLQRTIVKLLCIGGLVILIFVFPATAFACPLCQDQLSDLTATAFSVSALLMAGMPFLLIGFIGVQVMRAINPEVYEHTRNYVAFLLKPRWVRAALVVVFVMLGVYASPGVIAAFGRTTVQLPRNRLAAQTNLNGSPILPGQLQNKVVLVNFFASWCTPCKQEVTDLGELYREYKAQGVEIIGVALDFEHQDEPGAQPHIHPDGIVHFHAQPYQLQLLLAFLRVNRASYPVIPVAPEIYEPFGGVKAIPAIYLFDAHGVLSKAYTGLPPLATLKADVQKLLARAGD